MPASLQAILAPRSIAVIGASRTPGTIGHEIVRNLIRGGFTGSVYPVNPHARAICSIPAWPEVEAIPEQLDQAIIVVPKELVMGVAEAAIRKGVKGLVVISAGFREVGGEGAEREQRLTALVRAHGVRMIGPNCMGVMNSDPAVSMNGTFASSLPPTGTTGFVSQSGALGLSVLDYAREYGIGISQFVSVGNKPDVSGNDLLLAWESDPRVQVILMYVESFGNPARFLEIAGRLTREKPLIVVKSGRSRAGARAASSHTGALAASDAAVDALLAQAGVLRAGSIEELFDLAIAFSALLASSAAGQVDPPRYSMQCFRPERREGEMRYEHALNGSVSAEHLRGFHDLLASEPHLAGTEGDLRVIEKIAAEFEKAGLEVEVHWIWPYLSKPVKAEVEIVEPERMALEVTEPPIDEDPDTQHPNLTIGFNAYSGSGDVTGEVVYANYGRKEDFERLKSMGVDCTGKIVIARFGGNFRGYKARYAQEAGADLFVVQSTVTTVRHKSTKYKPFDVTKFCKTMKIPVITGNCVSYSVATELMEAGVSGLLIGVGARTACGCTSGHGSSCT